MKFTASMRTLLVAAVLCVAAVGTQAPAAAAPAEPIRYLHMGGVAECDAAAGEWLITWTVTNLFDQGAALGNVRMTPAGHPINDLEGEIPAGGTISGWQRIPSDQYSASFTFDANWADNVVSYNVWWPVHIKTTCRA